ncbi:MAG: SIS domain-containing protein [Magnetococcales bacterium]|nr:SIS domain-containing protein [Magnetococcales bacterium]
MTSEIRQLIEESIAVKQAVLNDPHLLAQIETLAEKCLRSLRSGGKILFAGNGGSFADAQHLSAELTARFQIDRAPLPSLALGTNNSAISAIGNDYGYEQVFARELHAIARPEDLFIPITTSGNSPNILAAIEAGQRLGIAMVGLTGQEGGRMKTLCDCICIPSKVTARIQECHILVGHILCGWIESRYFAQDNA